MSKLPMGEIVLNYTKLYKSQNAKKLDKLEIKVETVEQILYVAGNTTRIDGMGYDYFCDLVDKCLKQPIESLEKLV